MCGDVVDTHVQLSSILQILLMLYLDTYILSVFPIDPVCCDNFSTISLISLYCFSTQINFSNDEPTTVSHNIPLLKVAGVQSGYVVEIESVREGECLIFGLCVCFGF